MTGVFKQIKLFFQTLWQLPYKWYWCGIMACSTVLFSWWDEIAIWTIGIAWDWRIIPIYYIIEYGVMIPLVLVLTKKTYKKLDLKVDLRQVFIQMLKNSLPCLIYRKLRKKKKE